MNPTRYFLYARKSTDTEDRQIRSIDDQIAELHDLAAKSNIVIVETFLEKQSAKAPGRPILNDMLARIEAGEAEGIIAWHPDRLARNSIDGGRIVYLLDTGKLKDLKFCTLWFENTPQGKFMLQIAFSQSKYYVDNLSENIKRGHRQKLKNGLWSNMAPLGYLNDKSNKVLVLDPPKAALVRKAFVMYATSTYSYSLLCSTMTELGLLGRKNKQMGPANFQYLLKNPFYCGLIRFNGELYEGKHEPIISKALFDQVQDKMNNRCKPNKKKAKYFVFRGLIHCGECGCLITAEKQKGHNYYRCTKRKGACSQPYLREEKLAEQMKKYFQTVSIPQDCAEWLIAELEKEKASHDTDEGAHIENLMQQMHEIDAKIDRLTDAYLEQVISLPEFQNQKNRLLESKQRIKDDGDCSGLVT